MSEAEAKPGELAVQGKSTIEILAQIDLFNGVPHAHLRRVVDIGVEEQYRASATIFAEGAPGDKFYLIVEGAVRISRIVPGMGEEALAVLRAGAYFGEMSLIDDAPRSAAASVRAAPHPARWKASPAIRVPPGRSAAR